MATTISQKVAGTRSVFTQDSATNRIGTRIMCGTGQGVFGQSGNDYTWSLQCALPQDFVAVRLVLMNTHTASITGVKVAASVGATGTDRLNNAGTWVNGTFSGAATGTLAAATANDPSITLSDWIELSSTARGDGGTYPLVYVRCLTPSANASAPLAGLGVDVSGWATKTEGDIWTWRFQSGDYIATPSGMTGSADPSGAPIAGVQYLSATGAVLSVAAFGDSTLSAYLSTIPGNSWIDKAVQSYGTTASPANFGWSGHSTAQALACAKTTIPVLKPVVAFWNAFSPNDGTPTAATVAVEKSRMVEFIELCRQYKVIPAVVTGFPKTTDNTNAASSYTNGQDDFRKAINTSAIAQGVTVVDFAAITSNQNATGTASKWSAGSMTVDGTHPSDACHTTVSAAVATVLNTMTVSV